MCNVDIKQVEVNLKEMKQYAEKYPTNAGWRWLADSLDKTLGLLEPEEAEASTEGFDMPQEPEKPEPEPEPEPQPEPEPEPEPEPTPEPPTEG